MRHTGNYAFGCAGAMGALLIGLLACGLAFAQAPKYLVTPETPVAPLQYRGLVPGLDTHAKVREVLGEPVFEASWYNYKLYYPAEGRDGKIDVVHLHGKEPEAKLADIEAATVPEGYTTGDQIREKLGKPEYELHMPTWSLLDYSSKGLRFSLNADGNTTGVVYFSYGYRRVPEGERRVVDLRDMRQGEQPRPETPASLDGLTCGTAEREITPQEGWLNHEFTVNDPLFVRIAVFRRGDLTVAFAGADVFGMGKQDLDVIREAVREQFGVDYLVFAMSHNHASGDTSGFYGYYPLEYVGHIQKQTIEGVGEAVEKLEAVAEFRTASKELPMDGARVQGLFRNARNPGVLDPTISVMQAVRGDGTPITTMVNFACHTESIENGGRIISGDFPSFMCNQIKADGGGQPVFLNGAVGGMVSGDNPERTPESAKEMGEKLARIAKVLSENAVPPSSFAFNAETRELQVPVTNQAFLPLFEEGPRSMHKGRVITDMTYIQIGEAQFVTLPGELLPEVSYEILEHMDGFPRVLIGLGNDQLGYMVPPYDFRNDYYEESVSVGPAMATQVRDMAIRMLDGSR